MDARHCSVVESPRAGIAQVEFGRPIKPVIPGRHPRPGIFICGRLRRRSAGKLPRPRCAGWSFGRRRAQLSTEPPQAKGRRQADGARPREESSPTRLWEYLLAGSSYVKVYCARLRCRAGKTGTASRKAKPGAQSTPRSLPARIAARGNSFFPTACRCASPWRRRCG